MPYYRLYHMHPKSGHIDRFDEFEVSDDIAAVIFAETKLNAHPLELWQHGRKVKRFDPAQVGDHVKQVWAQQGGNPASSGQQPGSDVRRQFDSV